MILIIFMIAFVFECSLQASTTFFSPRGITTNLVLGNRFFDKGDKKIVITGRPFIQKADVSAAYFFPHNKSHFNLNDNGLGDVSPVWMGLIPSQRGVGYNTCVSADPTRKTYGAVISAMIDFSKICDGLWAEISTALIKTSHAMNIKENYTNRGGGIPEIDNFCDAWNQQNLWYSKISCKELTKKGLDDIQIRSGVPLFEGSCSLLHLYGVATIATGDTPQSRYLFEPLVGSEHYSLGFGLTGTYAVPHECSTTSWLVDARYRYVFSALEKRSFDFYVNGPWSRYLGLVQPGDVSAPVSTSNNSRLRPIPAVNLTTLYAEICPKSTVDFLIAVQHDWQMSTIELGCFFWWRDKEEIYLRDCDNFYSELGGIFDLSRATCDSQRPFALSADHATINQSHGNSANALSSDTVFRSKTLVDIDCFSAAHPMARSITWYIAINMNNKECCYSVPLFGIGFAYEYAWNNNACDQFMVWAHVTHSF